MRKQQRLSQVRSNFQKESRRHNLDRVFREHRRIVTHQTEVLDEKEFAQIYPTIDDDNFEQHLPFLLKYCFNQHYNYRLVIFGTHLYEHLLENPGSIQALQILESLSQFQELQLPQTEELVDIFVGNLEGNCKTVLFIVANLLQHYRYCGQFRDMLAERDFVEASRNALKATPLQVEMEATLNYVYLQILCSMVTTHPIIEHNYFEFILTQLPPLLRDEESLLLLLDKLCSLCVSLAPDQDKALLLYSTFENILLKEYFSYEQEIVSILLFCIKSKIAISTSFHPLLTKSLTSSIPNMKEKVLLIFDFLQREGQGSECPFNQESVMEGLLASFGSSKIYTQVKIMRFMGSIITGFLGEVFAEAKMIEEAGGIASLPKLLQVFKGSLEFESVELRQATMEVIFVMLSVLLSQESSDREWVLARIDEEGLMVLVCELSQASHISSSTSLKIEQALQLYVSMASSL